MIAPAKLYLIFRGWPTSRKNAVLLGLALPFHVFCTLSIHLVAGRYSWVDRALLDTVYWYWNAEIAIAFLISLFATLRGWDGEWTFWLNMVPYGIFMVTGVTLFGFASTAFVTWFPSVVVLNTVWFSPRLGIFSFLYGIGLIAIYSALIFSGLVPYAPALLDRNLDVQNSPLWTMQVFGLVLIYFAFCLALVVLLMMAQEHQQLRLNEARTRLKRSNDLISRYVPVQLAERIIAGDHSESFRPERTKLTIVFTDIEDFTDASDRLDPEELAGLLNEYLSEMVGIADRFGATVNQIVGDGIMMFFGAPQATSDEDHALRAVQMSQAMQRRMEELKDVWVRRGIQRPFQIRIGINTGHASVGDYGSPGRKLYSAIGVQTNLAARIQSHCEPGRILLSYTTWCLVCDAVDCVERGELPLKGLHYPVRLYEVSTQSESSRPRLVASRA